MQENWRDVLRAISEKNTNQKQYRQIYIGGIYVDDLLKTYRRKKTEIKKHRVLKNYYLNEPFYKVYFTQRELDCLKLLKLGLTNREVGERLGLSERTIEFYIRNMREKTGCMSKVALIEKMQDVNFTEKNNNAFKPTKIKHNTAEFLKHKTTNKVSNP